MTGPAQTKIARPWQVLLVDDDKEFTLFFKEFLLARQPGKWVVHTADHYAPALTCIKEHPIELAVVDLKMPVMDGLQLLTLLKRTHPEIQVIILTSLATPENRAQSLQNGAALFFDKTEVTDNLEKIYLALETVASTPTEGFRGMLRQVGLPDVLQMECLGRKSSVLEVRARENSGRIYISEGSIVHAEIGDEQGEAALFGLLGLSGGDFQIRPFSKPPRHTIDGHWESLLMESARLRDEASAGGPLDESGAVIQQAKPGPAAATQPRRQIQEIVLSSATGELLYEWESARVEKRLQLLNQLATLFHSIGPSLNWTRGERLEILSGQDRVLMLFQPDRKVLLRSTALVGEGR